MHFVFSYLNLLTLAPNTMISPMQAPSPSSPYLVLAVQPGVPFASQGHRQANLSRQGKLLVPKNAGYLTYDPAFLSSTVLIRLSRWKTLLKYIYTDEVSFLPLKSSGRRQQGYGIACSPKSMFRLAKEVLPSDLPPFHNLFIRSCEWMNSRVKL